MSVAYHQISMTRETAERKLRMAREDLEDVTMRIRRATDTGRFDLVAQYATLAQAAQEKVEVLCNLAALLDDCAVAARSAA